MTDMTPDFDFTAAANAAIAEAEGAAPEPAVEEPSPETVERPRDEQGRFVAQTEEPAEPEAEPEVEAAEPDVQPDVLSELETLRKRLADKDEFISRQGNELGELRKAFEERFDTLEQRQNQPPPQQVTEDLIDRDPAGAARLAWEQGNQAAFGVAFQAWKDDDPAAAGAWAAYTAAQQEMAAREAAYEQRLAEMEARIGPLSQATVEQRRAQEVRQLTQEIPADELTTFLESEHLQALAQEFPWASPGLASEDPAELVATIKSLYFVHRGRAADTLNRTAQQVAQDAAEQAERAAQDAYVASASTATATTAENKSEADLIAERMTARIKQRESVWSDAWERG